MKKSLILQIALALKHPELFPEKDSYAEIVARVEAGFSGYAIDTSYLYNTEAETPRLDNAYGLVLISNKKDGYTVLGPDKTGLYINGNAKSIKLIEQTFFNKILAIVATNNAELEAFELNSTGY